MKISMPPPPAPFLVQFRTLAPGDCFYTAAGEPCMRIMGPFDHVNTVVFGRCIARHTHDLTIVQKVEADLSLKDSPGSFTSPVIYERGGEVPPRPLCDGEIEMVKQGRRIDAIRAYRERNGSSLLEAKDATDVYLQTPEGQKVVANWSPLT